MACNSINSTIEIFTITLLLVLLFSVVIKKRKWTKSDRLFLLTLLLHMVNTMGDLAAWRFTCKEGMLALALTGTGNFLTYFVGALAYFSFLTYIYSDAVGNMKLPGWCRALTGMIGVLCLFLMGLPIHNFWSGVLYRIDENNVFTWGALSSVPDNIVLVQILLLVPVILYAGNKKGMKDTSAFLIYLSVPAIGIVLEIWQPYLMLLYPSVAISLLLICVVNQQKQEKQLIQKELELSDSRIRAMVSQMQPHFLYNALNSIYHLCEKDTKKARQAISDFSDYLRMNLSSLNQSAPIPFTEELKHVKTYLQLEKMRFEEELNIVLDIDTADFLLPALTVQPLVENAVKHGIYPKDGGGTVTLTARECPEYYEIRVSDDGVGFRPEAGQTDGKVHIGIANTRKRLEAMCGGSLEIDSRPGDGTTVVVRIPKRQP